jgi:hypothetical protein
MCDIPPQRKIWMTDLALAWIGSVVVPATMFDSAAVGGASAPQTRGLGHNKPAVLNKPIRNASRRDSGILTFMPNTCAYDLGLDQFVLIILLRRLRR